MSKRVAANLYFVMLCWIWGSTWLAIKWGLVGVPPATGVALRFAFSGALLFAVALLFRTAWPRGAGFRLQVLIQGATIAANYFLIYWAEQTVPSGLTAVLFAVTPILISVIAALVFRIERFNAYKIMGLLVGFGGVVVIYWAEVVRAAHAPWQGVAAVLLSALIAAFSLVSIKHWGADFPPLAIAATSQLLAGLFLALLALVLDLHTPVHFSVQAVAALAYLTIFGSAIAFLAYYWLLRVIPATRVSLFLYVTPVVAVVLGTLLGHEQLAVQTGIGAVLVFASIALMHVGPKP